VIDREKLKQTGAVTLSFKKDGRVEMRAARAPDEDRPWSPAPKRGWGRAAPQTPAKGQAGQLGDEEPETSDEAFSVD
jgi:competence protein ComEC